MPKHLPKKKPTPDYHEDLISNSLLAANTDLEFFGGPAELAMLHEERSRVGIYLPAMGGSE